MREWNRAHLTVVDENFPKKRAQRLPVSVLENGRPEFKLLPGGWHKPWKALSRSERTAQAVLSFDPYTERFTLQIFKAGSLFETRTGKRSQHSELSLWLLSADDKKLRIPWAKVEAGLIWRSDVEIHDFYFQRLEEEMLRKQLEEVNASRLEGCGLQ
jgi:hypothetical protein